MQLTHIHLVTAGLSSFGGTRLPKHDAVVFVGNVQDGVPGRDLGRHEQADPAGFDGLIARFRALGEAGSNLLAPEAARHGNADADAGRVHAPSLERTSQDVDGASGHGERHAGMVSEAAG